MWFAVTVEKFANLAQPHTHTIGQLSEGFDEFDDKWIIFAPFIKGYVKIWKAHNPRGYWDLNPGPGASWLVWPPGHQFLFDIPHFQHKKSQTLLRYLTECISLNLLGLSTHRSQKLAIREDKTWNMRSNVDKWPNSFKTKPKITLLQQTQSLLPRNGLNGGEAHTVTEFHLLTDRSAAQFKECILC